MTCQGGGKVETLTAADTIYTNGNIYTVNEAQPWAEAVAIKDGKFIKVGSNAEVQVHEGDDTEVIDLSGKFAMPGMIDVHTHAIESHGPAMVRLLLEQSCPHPRGSLKEFRLDGALAHTKGES